MLRERALRFEPDLALVSLTALAVPRMLADSREQPPREALRLVAPDRVRSLFAQLVRARLGLWRSSLAVPSFDFPPRVPDAQQVVTQLGALARSAGLPVVVVRLEYDSRPPSALEREVERRVRGHRIRVQVSSGAHPRFARNLGTGEPLATGTTLRASEQSIHHEPGRASAILLPIHPA